MLGRVALRSACMALVAAGALLVAGASPASAHAAFLSSDPTDGAILDAAPAAVSLHFSEKVLLESSHVDLIELGKGTTLHLVLSGSDNGQTVSAVLPALTRGAYVVRFTVVDPADLHRTVGSIAFGVGVAPPVSASGGQLDASWWSVAVTALGFAAVVIVIGAAALLWIAADAVRRQRAMLLGLVRRFGLVIAAAWTVSFLLEGAAIGWGRAAWVRLLVASDPGRRALLGVVLAAATWWLVQLVRPAMARSADRLVTSMAMLFVVVGAYGGHSAIGGNQWVGSALRLVHFAAISLWIGAVAVAWWCTHVDESAQGLWRPVGRVAGWAAALTGLSGFVLSGRTVATVTALLRTQYGFVVLVKVSCLIVAAVVGWSAARRIRREQQPRVAPELVVGAIALVAAALLGGSAPAVGPQFAAVSAVSPQVATGDLADLTVSVNLSPARVGANLLQVEVLNTRRPEPGVIRSVRVRLERQGRVVVDHQVQQPTGSLEWSDDQLPTSGSYRVVVDVDRPDAPVPAFQQVVTVASVPVRLVPTRLSRSSWMPLAALVGALWATMVLVVTRRRAAAAI